MIIEVLLTLGVGFLGALLGIVVITWMNAGRQQHQDWQMYGIRSTRWQIVLEIWGFRKVR